MSFKKIISELFFPSGIKCIACDAEFAEDVDTGFCGDCAPVKNDVFCTKCGRKPVGEASICDDCRDSERNFDLARSVYIYGSGVKSALYSFKYGNAKYIADYFYKPMTDLFLSLNLSADIVTFVPLHKKRERTRGYNQAKLLADKIAAELNLPCEPLLKKTVYTKNLAKLTLSNRREKIKNSFEAIEVPNFNLKGKSVLLIDDVLTTCATADECAKTLKAAKAKHVYVLTAASTPPPPPKKTVGTAIGRPQA